MQELFIEKKDCCGCEACALSCPKHIIIMRQDEEGFLYPSIVNEENCVNCGRCLAVCPVKSPGRGYKSIMANFGGYVLQEEDLKKSASGGYATAIGQNFIEHGGIVYGVRYSEDFKEAVFSRATNTNELEKFRTSKYSQARKGNIYADVLSDLKKGTKVLFVGLPCEVSSLYHCVGHCTEGLYTISLICHGPTSPKVHKDFCDNLEKKYKSSLDGFSLRYKLNGWKPYYIKAEFKDGQRYLKPFENSDYGISFQYLKRPSCYVCKYKSRNRDFGLVSDLTIGDYHTARSGMPHFNSWGVSQASVQTEKGEYLMSLLSNCCSVNRIPMDVVINSNIAFHQPIPVKKGRSVFSHAYRLHSLSYACKQPSVLIPYKKRQCQKRLKKRLFPVVRLVRRLFHHG